MCLKDINEESVVEMKSSGVQMGQGRVIGDGVRKAVGGPTM